MAKKRKRSSIASFVHHLEPCSSSSPSTSDKFNSNKALNLSAYHPDLDPSLITNPDYTSLLSHSLVHPSQFPLPLLKYWRHRFSLFSLYSSGCLLDQQSWYSITPESVAFRIAKRCATDHTIIDLFAGAGGNAIQFAMTCAKVIAVEIDPVKLNLARWNAKVYRVEDRIQFVNGDCLDLMNWLEERRSSGSSKEAKEEQEGEGKGETWNGLKPQDLEKVEAVFLSPPWGGVDYATHPPTTNQSTTSSSSIYSLASIQPLHGSQLFHRVSSAFQTSNIAYYLPRNTCLTQLSQLSSQPQKDLKAKEGKVKVEYQYLNYGSKLSSLTAYYADLATEWDDEMDDWKPQHPSSSST